MRFKNDIVVVTGGGSGIGEASARAFASEGARVAVADRDIANARRVTSELASAGLDAIAVPIDVAEEKSIDGACSEVESRFGGSISVLVNSAGLMGLAPITDYSLGDWERIIAVNVTGTFLCAKRVAPGMQKARYGRIVNLASISAVRAGIGRAAYGTSKAAVAGLTRQLAMELGSFGITANAVAPGPVMTAMTRENYQPNTVAAYTNMIPARRFGTPEEMAHAVLFLSSREAGFVNGILLPVDGGYLAGGVATTGTMSSDT
ncbi:3-oxoacyl-[acyl-carrier-protein] reductase FabG [compost metagenome]